MFSHFAIKTSLSAAAFQFANQTGFRQDFQITINGPQADPGQTASHHIIDLLGRGMGLDFLELFQNYSALSADPGFVYDFHIFI
jgi:hypothetical protein